MEMSNNLHMLKTTVSEMERTAREMDLKVENLRVVEHVIQRGLYRIPVTPQ